MYVVFLILWEKVNIMNNTDEELLKMSAEELDSAIEAEKENYKVESKRKEKKK